jgi:hypothetical protein
MTNLGTKIYSIDMSNIDHVVEMLYAKVKVTPMPLII